MNGEERRTHFHMIFVGGVYVTDGWIIRVNNQHNSRNWRKRRANAGAYGADFRRQSAAVKSRFVCMHCDEQCGSRLVSELFYRPFIRDRSALNRISFGLRSRVGDTY